MSRPRARHWCKELRLAATSKPWFQLCDVRDVGALQAAINLAMVEVGDFATLVNNIARDDRHTLEAVAPEYWEELMAVNQRPAFFAIQSVVPGMKRLGGGSIINMGSTGWQTKGSEFPLYAIAKSPVNGLTCGMAGSLGPHRIRINTVSPGWVMTERQIKLWLNAEGEEAIKRNQCLPDKLQATDVARMVLFFGVSGCNHVHRARVQGGRGLELAQIGHPVMPVTHSAACVSQ